VKDEKSLKVSSKSNNRSKDKNLNDHDEKLIIIPNENFNE
jgi:hypothetical protein